MRSLRGFVPVAGRDTYRKGRLIYPSDAVQVILQELQGLFHAMLCGEHRSQGNFDKGIFRS